MHFRILAVLLLAAAASPSLADDIQPGLWELSLETRVPASPEYAPPPVTLRQCLTDQDARDPSRVLGGVANPGATDCVYTDRRYAGGRFHFAMECGGAFGIRASGDIGYSAAAMDGTLTSSAQVEGLRIEQVSRLSGRRLGGC